MRVHMWLKHSHLQTEYEDIHGTVHISQYSVYKWKYGDKIYAHIWMCNT